MRDGIMGGGAALIFWAVAGLIFTGLFMDWGWMWQLVLYSPLIIAGAASLYVFVLAPIFGAMSDAPAKRRDPGVPGQPKG